MKNNSKNQQQSVNSFTGSGPKVLSNLSRGKKLLFNKRSQAIDNRSRHPFNRRFGHYNKPRAAIGR